MTQIYYIEDDGNIAELVKKYLGQKGFEVTLFSTIYEAKTAINRCIPSLALIDRNMPDGEGDELCRWIRERWKQLPMIFLTVKNDTGDIVAGFHSGIDDYITKPFELEVLYSRIQALLRRAGNLSGHFLTCGELRIDKESMKIFSQNREVTLSQTEYQLILLLMENQGKTLTRERLLEHIWDTNGNFVNDNTLTVTMKRLREKLGQPACIKTIRSFGYRMEDKR